MNKELCKKSDYELIQMYKKNENKNEVLEVMYFRYKALIFKKSIRFCKIVGESWREDFQQEAFIKLVECLDSVDLDKVSDGWKIVHIYGLRLDNLGRLYIKKIVRGSDCQVSFEKGEGSHNIKMKVHSYKFSPKDNETGEVMSKSEYIEKCVIEKRYSYSDKKANISKLFGDFIQTVDKINGGKTWIKELLGFIHMGFPLEEAISNIDVSKQSWYNNKRLVMEQFERYVENHSIY